MRTHNQVMLTEMIVQPLNDSILQVLAMASYIGYNSMRIKYSYIIMSL